MRKVYDAPPNVEEAPQVDAVVAAEPEEEEIPEVFDLQPLERRLVTVVIGEVRPARFYFIDDDPGDEEIE